MSINYAKMDKMVHVLDGKKSGCKAEDGEFSCRVKIPVTHRNDKKAKSFGFIVESGQSFTEDKVEYIWYVSCRMIAKKDMISFHDNLSDDDKFKIALEQHKVKYRSSITTPQFLDHMGVVKVSEKQSEKIKHGVVKTIMSKKSIMIEMTMKNMGCTQEQAEELYQKIEDEAKI